MSAEQQTILVLEDSTTQQLLVRRSLEKYNYRLLMAKNGRVGFDILQKEWKQIGLIISDIEMPEMNGFDFCKKVKSHPDYANISFVLLTSLNNPDAVIRGVAVGADNYITKPFTESHFSKQIKKMVGTRVKSSFHQKPSSVEVDGKNYEIAADYNHIIRFLHSTFESILAKNRELRRVYEMMDDLSEQLQYSRQEMQKLLNNMMPEEIAETLLAQGFVDPFRKDNVSVMFTDFVGFSSYSEQMPANELVETLGIYFDAFDKIADKHNLEKIKTIGDSYMFASGVPNACKTHAIDCVLGALDIIAFVEERKKAQSKLPAWDIRVGINSGSVIAGVIGTKRHAFDIWGDTVNRASRMETNSQKGRINISESTYRLVNRFFECQPNGIFDGGSESVAMYLVDGLKGEFSTAEQGTPNDLFMELYATLSHKRA